MHNPEYLNNTQTASMVADHDIRLLAISPHVGNYAKEMLAAQGVQVRSEERRCTVSAGACCVPANATECTRGMMEPRTPPWCLDAGRHYLPGLAWSRTRHGVARELSSS